MKNQRKLNQTKITIDWLQIEKNERYKIRRKPSTITKIDIENEIYWLDEISVCVCNEIEIIFFSLFDIFFDCNTRKCNSIKNQSIENYGMFNAKNKEQLKKFG